MKTKAGSEKSGALESLLNDARAEANELRRRLQRYERILLSTRMIMAHELKKPATAICGYLDLVLEGDDFGENTKAIATVQKARDECELLNELNGVFLTLLELEREHDRLSGRGVDLEPFLAEIVDHLPPKLRGKERVEIVFQSKPTRFNVNPDGLRIILSNIVENALAYSPAAAPVRVNVEIAKDKRGVEPGDILKVKVTDRGSGVPEEYLQKIFSPFVRLPGETSQGSGLGLTLVRSLVELYGGTITIKCDEDQGTAVFVTVPAVADTEDGTIP